MQGLWARRRLVLTAALCILVAVLAAVVTGPLWHGAPQASTGHLATATAPKHTATWRPTYSIMPELLFEPTARPGDQIKYRWSSQLDTAPRSYAPGSFICTFALYGPYATEADARHASTTDLSTATPAVAAPPLTLNRWTSQPQPETLTLPQNLAPGYYAAVGRVVESGAGGTGRTTTNAALIQILG